MKAVDIVKEEFEKNGIEGAELLLLKVIESLEAIAPRLALEADESAAKIVGSGLAIALPVFKPTLMGLIDLNHDGIVG
jgi:hypothetical protein